MAGEILVHSRPVRGMKIGSHIERKCYRTVLFATFRKGQGCGEPPRIDNAQRFGSVSEVTYECIECYTGGGMATCTDGEWTHDGSCASKYYIAA